MSYLLCINVNFKILWQIAYRKVSVFLYIKRDANCLAFCKVSIFLYIKLFCNLFLPFVYIKHACCLSLMVVIVTFINIKKSIVLRNVFIYTKSKESILFAYGFFFQSKILRALLSYKNGILHLWKKPIIQELQKCAPIY